MNYRQTLTTYGLRVTKPRLSIIEELAMHKHPVSIDTLQHKLLASMELSTLYRSLSKMVEVGLVYRTDFRTGKAYFELHSPDHHHHHVVCTSCGVIEDIDGCLARDAVSKITKRSKKFSTISSHMLEFFGKCKKCEK